LIGHDLGADIATGAGLFVVTLMVLTVISHSIARGVRESSVGGLDKSLGFVFGLVRGAVLVCLIYIGASWFWTEEQLPDFVTQARAMPLVRGGADLLRTLVPEETRRKTEAATGSAKRKAETALKAERALRGLVRPTPQSTTGTKGYTRRQQRDMQRLIESKQ
jgi:membrane protein required for colicin V production